MTHLNLESLVLKLLFEIVIVSIYLCISLCFCMPSHFPTFILDSVLYPCTLLRCVPLHNLPTTCNSTVYKTMTASICVLLDYYACALEAKSAWRGGPCMANTALPITAFTALTDIAEDEQVMIYERIYILE